MTSQKRTDQEHELLLALIAGSDSPMAADMGRHDAIYSLLDRTAAIADMLAIGDFPGMDSSMLNAIGEQLSANLEAIRVIIRR
ncbi:hypothetical protein [Methylohalobius crimeensis]|uniref:hypothetical protein n=1 Tax=Methylohalobius crimeensis TaxID=244365 RepID=UPI0003B3E1B1|nr:hypothetical protein [Methylohalobius crimeensis]